MKGCNLVRVHLFVWWLLRRSSLVVRWTAKSWKLTISWTSEFMFVFSRKNIQIQYRPENKTKQNIDLVSRQMALERDPGLGYPSTPSVNSTFTFLPTVGPRKTTLLPSFMCNKVAGGSRPQLHVLQHSKPRTGDSYKTNCLPVTPEPGLEPPLCPVPPSAKGRTLGPFPGFAKGTALWLLQHVILVYVVCLEAGSL